MEKIFFFDCSEGFGLRFHENGTVDLMVDGAVEREIIPTEGDFLEGYFFCLEVIEVEKEIGNFDDDLSRFKIWRWFDQKY